MRATSGALKGSTWAQYLGTACLALGGVKVAKMKQVKMMESSNLLKIYKSPCHRLHRSERITLQNVIAILNLTSSAHDFETTASDVDIYKVHRLTLIWSKKMNNLLEALESEILEWLAASVQQNMGSLSIFHKMSTSFDLCPLCPLFFNFRCQE